MLAIAVVGAFCVGGAVGVFIEWLESRGSETDRQMRRSGQLHPVTAVAGLAPRRGKATSIPHRQRERLVDEEEESSAERLRSAS